MRAQHLPVFFVTACAWHGGEDDLEVIGFAIRVPIGDDNQPVARRVIVNFIFNAGLARCDTDRCGFGRMRINQPSFCRFMVMRGNNEIAPRACLGKADKKAAIGFFVNAHIILLSAAQCVTHDFMRAVVFINRDIEEILTASRPAKAAAGIDQRVT